MSDLRYTMDAIGLPLYSSWSFTAIAGLGLAFLVRSIYRTFIYPFYFSPYRNLPEPEGKTTFPWAHAQQIREATNGEPYRKWINSVPNDGIIRFRVLGNEERLLLTKPAQLREVLVNQSYKFEKPVEPAHLFRALLGNGLLIAEGDDHKAQRKAIMPAFSYRHIKDLYPIFWSKAKLSTEAIHEAQQYDVINGKKRLRPQMAYAWAHRVTLDIIGLAGLGHEFDAIRNPHGPLVEAYHLMFGSEGPLFYWTSIGLNISVRWALKLPVPQFIRLRRAVATVQTLVEDLVSNKKDKSESIESVDIASVMIRSGQFSDSDLVDQMKTFLAAGHETTASALTWAIYLLCLHPDVQTWLRAEIRENVPDLFSAEAGVDADLIDGLPYLNAVCNEVLRFMPSVPMTMRRALEDVEICGQYVREGTHIVIAAWAVNVSHELWGEDAHLFDPDRWLRHNNGGADSNFSNLTFIHGARSCIGKSFAKSEFLCLLMAWIGRFQVHFEGEEPLPKDIIGWVTAKPGHRLPVVFEEVEA